MPCCCATTAASPSTGKASGSTSPLGRKPRSSFARPNDATARWSNRSRRSPTSTSVGTRHGQPSWPTIYISPQVETILGYSPEEWRDDPALWGSLIHPDDVERSHRGGSPSLRDRGAPRHRGPAVREGRLDPLDPGRGDPGSRRRGTPALEPGHPARYHGTQARRAGTARRGRALSQPDRDDPRRHLHRYGRRGFAGRLHEPAGRGHLRVHARGMAPQPRALGAGRRAR